MDDARGGAVSGILALPAAAARADAEVI